MPTQNVTFKDYYAVLGVPRNADEKTIRTSFRNRAKELHPDVNRNDPKAEERFKELNEAYEVLSNADRRKMYDRFGEDWKRYQDAGVSADDMPRGAASGRPTTTSNQDFGQWFAGGDGSFTFESADSNGRFSDFFNLLFGDRGPAGPERQRAGQARRRRGEDLEAPTTITLQEAATGTQRRLSVRAPSECSLCHGTGEVRGAMCPRCDGSGTEFQVKELEVTIPKGVRTGSRVRISGKGGPGMNGGPAGDVYLVIKVVSNDTFERTGDDLRTTVRLPLTTAVLGGDAVVPTLGKSVVLSIPAGTQNGKLFRLRGKGMPKLGKDAGMGDLLVRVEVAVPTSISSEERALYEKIRSLQGASQG